MSEEGRKQLSNKAEHVWLGCFRAALTGLARSRVGLAMDPRFPMPAADALAAEAAALADEAFKEARKRILIGRPGAWPDPDRQGWKCPTCGIFNDEHADLVREKCRGLVSLREGEAIRAIPCPAKRPAEAAP